MHADDSHTKLLPFCFTWIKITYTIGAQYFQGYHLYELVQVRGSLWKVFSATAQWQMVVVYSMGCIHLFRGFLTRL